LPPPSARVSGSAAWPRSGYDTKDRRITVNEAEAETVRTIFRSYLKLGSLNLLMADLRKRGVVTKVRTLKTGATVGGIPFTRGPLAHLLRNRFYIGDVPFKGEILKGEQQAIVDRDLFEAVQAKLSEQVNGHKAARMKSEALLIGRIFDDRGNRMSPSHVRKGGVKYRYYLSSALLQGMAGSAGSVCRVPAADIEALVITSVREHLQTTAPIDDRSLIETHVARVEGPAGATGHPACPSKDARRSEGYRRQDPECPVAQDTVNTTPGASSATGNSTSTRSSDTLGVPRAPGRIDCARPPLARRTSCRRERKC
jgi:site-specific DNA recombinase